MGRRRYAAAFSLLALLLVLLFVWNLCAGSVSIGAGQIRDILLGRAADETARSIILQIRLPRILTAILLGGALSVSGFLLQTFFHNPIAGPFVLGISSGAKLVVALVMIGLLARGIHVSAMGMVLAAFAGSMLSMGFVLVLAGRVQRMSMLIVAGVMISYICSAVTDFAVTFADDTNIVNLHSWSLGSFSGADWGNLGYIAVLVVVAMTAVLLLSKPIGAVQLGEHYAQNLGVNVRALRAGMILLSSLLSACVTAFAGPISFVGIAVPHLVRGLLRTEKPLVLLPGCFLGGAVFCLFSDLIARSVFAPTELSISSVTALLGAPVVLVIMIRRRRDE